jgi:FAD/FMN-containing dehydrogenase
MPFSPLVSELRRRLGSENVLSAPSELTVYDCDALTIARRPPEVVVFPRSTRHVVATVEAWAGAGKAEAMPRCLASLIGEGVVVRDRTEGRSGPRQLR